MVFALIYCIYFVCTYFYISGTPTVTGQIIGGRWKPLHYILKGSTFVDQIASCDSNGNCFVKNDSPFPFVGELAITLTRLADGKQVRFI
jgi:beta-mannosidase